MVYKASFYNNSLHVEQVIGMKDEDGNIVIASCGVYKRNLCKDEGQGVMFEESAYAMDEATAVGRLTHEMVKPIIAAREALKARRATA